LPGSLGRLSPAVTKRLERRGFAGWPSAVCEGGIDADGDFGFTLGGVKQDSSRQIHVTVKFGVPVMVAAARFIAANVLNDPDLSAEQSASDGRDGFVHEEIQYDIGILVPVEPGYSLWCRYDH
jgi:hypothetical protein